MNVLFAINKGDPEVNDTCGIGSPRILLREKVLKRHDFRDGYETNLDQRALQILVNGELVENTGSCIRREEMTGVRAVIAPAIRGLAGDGKSGVRHLSREIENVNANHGVRRHESIGARNRRQRERKGTALWGRDLLELLRQRPVFLNVPDGQESNCSGRSAFDRDDQLGLIRVEEHLGSTACNSFSALDIVSGQRSRTWWSMRRSGLVDEK